MKYLAGILACFFVMIYAGEKNSCCGPTATEEFAAFGKDMAFVAMHEAPEPFDFQSTGGVMKAIESSDGVDAHIYEIRSSNASNNYLFVFQECCGLNDYIKRESERLHKELGNVNVIALDLYDGKVAFTADSARKYVSSTDESRIRAIIEATTKYVGPKARVATIGWCFGGGWSLQAALQIREQAVGCVIYYGMPEKDVKKLEALNCDVLGIFAMQDNHINPQVVSEFEKNMKNAKKHLSVVSYDAVHAFANPSNPKYDKEKTALANEAALKYLKLKFQK